ncbi:hypothetical protein [Inoviridae sp.]|nr:hypothetical protein [Inoviridae sp.]
MAIKDMERRRQIRNLEAERDKLFLRQRKTREEQAKVRAALRMKRKTR